MQSLRERREREREGEATKARAVGGGQKQLAWHPISPRHASEGGDTRCSLSQGGKRRLLEMSLHEYIDIPLEGSLFTVRLHSVLHCFFGGLSLSLTLLHPLVSSPASACH